MQKYHEILRALREDNDLKQKDIAAILNITQQRYSKYEKGENELPILHLAKLADYYQVSTDFILGRTNCKHSISILNKPLYSTTTIGDFINTIAALPQQNTASLYDFAQYLKNKPSTI